VKNWVNWLLVSSGGILIIIELILGAVTGFDLALLGISLAAGGALGLLFSSTQVGLFSAGALSLAYFAFLRKWIRSALSGLDRLSNVDAIVGQTGVVIARVAAHEPGQVKVGDEIWRAVLASPSLPAREAGEIITVESVDGVTVHVR
jgi:membrane protein implicated in regulation of membrane protease activity